MSSIFIYVIHVYMKYCDGLKSVGYLDFSLLCTLIPESEKFTERHFAPVELSFRETFAPEERKVQELSLLGTFGPVELSLLRSECCKNSFLGTFAPVELSVPYLKKLGKALQQSVHRHILANRA